MAASPSPLIADVLATSLESVLDNLCLSRYDQQVISLSRIEDTESPPSTIGFRLDRAGLPSLESRFTVRHVGGNVYEITGEIDKGRTRSFTYCLPNPAPLLVPNAPKLAADIALFLLEEMEGRLGRALLKGEITHTTEPTPSPLPKVSGSTPQSAKA